MQFNHSWLYTSHNRQKTGQVRRIHPLAFYTPILAALSMVLVFLFSRNVGIYDWQKELLYTEFIQRSLLAERGLPLMWWGRSILQNYPIVQQSAFFPDYPETFLFSPFTPLLLLLSPASFLKMLFFIHFLIGVGGALKLSARLNFDRHQTGLFCSLFLLSPIFFQHTSIGYLPWINLYLFPWLMFFILQRDFIISVLGAAAMLALGLLQGGTHVVFWLIVLLVFYGFWSAFLNRKPEQMLKILLSLAVTPALSLVRVFSTLQAFGQFEQLFFPGFSPRAFARMTLIPPLFFIRDMDGIEHLIEFFVDGVPYWDAGTYWGLLLPAALVAGYGFLRRRGSSPSMPTSRLGGAIFLASLCCLALSFEPLYRYIITLITDFIPLPALASTEKYPYRFSIPAYFGFSLAVACSWPELTAGTHNTILWASRLFKKFLSGLGVHRKAARAAQFVTRTSATLIGLTLTARLAWFAFLQKIFTRTVEQAYNGSDWAWLSQRMTRKETLPLEAYLQKGEALLSRGVRISLMVLISLLVISLVIRHAARLWQALNSLRPPAAASVCRSLELLLALPLAFACLMWLRVLVSTPVSSFVRLPEQHLPLQILSPAGAYPQQHVNGSNEVIITCLAGPADTCQLIADIPYSDVGLFVQDETSPTWFNANGQLGLTLPAQKPVHLTVKTQPFMATLHLTLAAWVASAFVLLIRSKTSKHVGLEKQK